MNPKSFYQIDRLDTLGQLDALEKEWTDLISGISAAPIFLTWEWIRTWWLFFNRGHKLWLLTARDRQGVLVGLAPWMSELHKIGLLNIRTIAFIGSNLVSPVHLNILAHPTKQQELLQVFMDFLLSQSGQWDAIRFEAVAQESAVNNLQTVNGARVGTKVISPYIPLPDNWDKYLKTLSKKLRRNLKYFRSKLESDNPGVVNFTCLSDPGEIDGSMIRLEELNRARRHDQGLSSAFDDSIFCSFHSSIAHLALAKGWLRLYKLTVKEYIIALFYCFRFQDHIYAYQIGFDLDWKGYSPGRLLIAYGIQSAIEEAACELDWLAGEHDYKLAWTDQVRVEYEILYRNNWRGDLWIRGKLYWKLLRGKAKQLLPQSTQHRIKQFLAAQNGSAKDRNDNDEERPGTAG